MLQTCGELVGKQGDQVWLEDGVWLWPLLSTHVHPAQAFINQIPQEAEWRWNDTGKGLGDPLLRESEENQRETHRETERQREYKCEQSDRST